MRLRVTRRRPWDGRVPTRPAVRCPARADRPAAAGVADGHHRRRRAAARRGGRRARTPRSPSSSPTGSPPGWPSGSCSGRRCGTGRGWCSGTSAATAGSGWTKLTTATIDRTGRDLGEVLDATAPTGPVVLAGHSMGGMSILALARQRPELFGDRVVGVFLLATSAGGLVETGVARPVDQARPVAAPAAALPAAPAADRAAARALPAPRHAARPAGHPAAAVRRRRRRPGERPRWCRTCWRRRPYPVAMAFYATFLDHDETRGARGAPPGAGHRRRRDPRPAHARRARPATSPRRIGDERRARRRPRRRAQRQPDPDRRRRRRAAPSCWTAWTESPRRPVEPAAPGQWHV